MVRPVAMVWPKNQVSLSPTVMHRRCGGRACNRAGTIPFSCSPIRFRKNKFFCRSTSCASLSTVCGKMTATSPSSFDGQNPPRTAVRPERPVPDRDGRPMVVRSKVRGIRRSRRNAANAWAIGQYVVDIGNKGPTASVRVH